MTHRRYWSVLAIALLTFPVCATMQDRVGPIRRVASVERVAVPDGTSASLPPFPTWVPTKGRPVPVRLVHLLTCRNGPAFGCFIYNRLPLPADDTLPIIQIEDTLPPVRRLYYLRHEIFHLAVYEAGLEFDNPDEENLVAEAVAAQQMREMLANWPPH